MVRASSIIIRLTRKDFTARLREKFKKSEKINYSDFKTIALNITKDMALKRIQHKYIGNKVGGYVNGLRIKTKKYGFEILATAPHSKIIEEGISERYAKNKPFVFRGYYSNRNLIKLKEGFFAKKLRTAKIKFLQGIKQAGGTDTANKIRKVRRLPQRPLAREQANKEAKNFSDVRKQLSLTEKKYGGVDVSSSIREQRKDLVKIQKPVYTKLRAKLRKSSANKRMKYGVFTVYAWKVKGFEGRFILRDSAKEIKKEALKWLKKRTVGIVTERKYGQSLSFKGG